MTRAEKTQLIDDLSNKLKEAEYFYITDSSNLTVEQVNSLRREFFEKGIEMQVVKNTLIRKALEKLPEEKNVEELYEVLKGTTSVLFTEVGNEPAKVIKEFRKKHKKPVLKAEYLDVSVYMGEEPLTARDVLMY